MRSFAPKVLPVSTFAAAASIMLIAPSETEASFGLETLREGMSSEQVHELQEVLRQKGYFTFHTSTGYFGTLTKEAVKQYQRDHQLQVDGIVGPLTFNALLSSAAKNETEPQEASGQGNSTATTYPTGSQISELSYRQTLREGMRGDEVKQLQIVLKEKGFFDYETATGYYGNITARAVRQYQQSRGLQADGIAGPATFNRLNQDLSSGSSSKPSPTSPEPEVKSYSTDQRISSYTTLLREGNQGEQVSRLQNTLTDLGYFSGEVNGQFGTTTRQAVTSFQRNLGIQVDGIAGPQTFSKLLSEQSRNQSGSSSPSSDSQNNFLLKEGHSGDSVTELQERLSATGHYDHRVTGYFGPITRSAVRAFQRQWSMVDDGIVTGSVWNKIDEVSSVHLDVAPSPSDSTSSYDRMNVIADASEQIGVPYQWGGVTPSGFDCSGFIQYVFKQNGVDMPRTVAEQWRAVDRVSQPRPGDLVFFETYKAGPSHNGIYVGNNQFIHSGTSTGVTISNMGSNYWKDRYLGAGRVK